MKLIYSASAGSVENATGSWVITAAPPLGFAFDGIFYSDNIAALKYIGAGRSQLTATEISSVVEWLSGQVMPAIPTPTLADLIAQAVIVQITIINAACQAALLAITQEYPALEVSTWDQQLAEAQAYTINNAVATPLLSAIAQANGNTVTALASSVLTLSAQYKAASGAAIGRRQLRTAQIYAAAAATGATVAQIQAIIW